MHIADFYPITEFYKICLFYILVSSCKYNSNTAHSIFDIIKFLPVLIQLLKHRALICQSVEFKHFHFFYIYQISAFKIGE